MEFVMNTDLEKSLPRQIDFNYDALKAELAERLEHYNNLVVTEDSIKDAKADKAALNKLKTALEDRRKQVKKDFMRPYDDFDRKVKELVGMIDAPVQSIDQQVKVFDEIKKQEKRSEIEAFYRENIGDLEPLLPLEKIFDARWLNVTYKASDIQAEIADCISKTKNEIEIIKTMRLECEKQVLDVYLRTLDMGAALAEKARLEAAQKRMEEYEAAQRKAVQGAAQEPKTVVIYGTPGHDLCDCRPGDRVCFGGEAITAYGPEATTREYRRNPAEIIQTPNAVETLKTIKVVFYDTTAEFRADMRALTEKYGIRYGGVK